MKKGLKKPIALLLSAMMIFSTSASAFPAMAEDNLIFEAENNSIHSDDYEFYNSESEITVTTCENEENSLETETTTVSTTTEVFVQSSEEQTESNPVEVYNSDYAVYAVSSSDEYEQPEGDGTQNNPYQISNSSQLFWFANQVNNKYGQASINAVLTEDIVVNDNLLDSLKFDEYGKVTNEADFKKWTPIGNSSIQYQGTFDGQNHTISGLYFNDDSIDYVGLFGYKNYGAIKNVGVIDSYFKGEDNVGGICGSINYGKIENSYNTGTISGSFRVGGVCGYSYLKCKITNSYNAGSVSGSNMYAGGVCGYKSDTSTIENSYNTGSVSGNQVVGGVCGQNINIITNVYNTGTVNGNSTVGGVCGHNDGGAIENNYNTGSVSGSEKVGSICGYSYYGTIKNSYYNSSISDKTVGSNNGGTFDITGKTSEQFESGEVAFLLEGIYGQEINKDKSPVLNGKKVYKNTVYLGCCEKYQGDITYVYSNKEANPVYSEHQYENGICTICGVAYEPAKLVDNYYQISNAGNLLWFAQQVNSGSVNINAVLTANIVVNTNVLNADGTLNSNLRQHRTIAKRAKI